MGVGDILGLAVGNIAGVATPQRFPQQEKDQLFLP
jgi:hypothetical protein